MIRIRNIKNKIFYIFNIFFKNEFYSHLSKGEITNENKEIIGYIENLIYKNGILHCDGWVLAKGITLHFLGLTKSTHPSIKREDVKRVHAHGEFSGFSFSLEMPNSKIIFKNPIGLTFENNSDASPIGPKSFRLKTVKFLKIKIFLKFILYFITALPDVFLYSFGKNEIHKRNILKKFPYSDVPKIFFLDSIFPSMEQLELHKPNVLNAEITIILPVYNAFELLKKCIDRVQKNTNIGWKLLIIEDCSTDELVRPYVEKLARTNKNIELIKNKNNLGFIKSVNIGFKFFLKNINADGSTIANHCVLLNSDAMVPKNWSSRLLQPILENDDVASVTPFSNDAELYSVPIICSKENLDSGQLDKLDEIASRFKPINDLITLPTGVGFCMAINQNWLKKIPELDEVFGLGYGEEVDWCQKIKKIGGKHIVAHNLFVEHRGGESFGSELKKDLLRKNGQLISKRYPDFDRIVQDFTHSDTLVQFRLPLAICWAASKKNIESIRFYIAHSLGGGAEHWLQSEISSHVSADEPVVVLRFGGQRRVCVEFISSQGTMKASANELDTVSQLLRIPDRKTIIYSSCVGDIAPYEVPKFLSENLSTKDKSILLFHDFFPISPSYTLLDDTSEKQKKWKINLTKKVHGFYDRDMKYNLNSVWQKAWKEFAKKSEIIVFSNNTKNIVNDIWPDFARQIQVKPHVNKNIIGPVTRKSDSDVLTLGVLGGINLAKGAGVISELSSLLDNYKIKPFKVVIIGEIDPAYKLGESIHVHGRYMPEDIKNLISKYNVSHWVVPSIWPETFCFTAHEALSTGLPVFSMDIGAHGDAISSSKNGIITPFTNSKNFARFIFDQMRSDIAKSGKYK
jgi:O-antigen biosynthesis protein